MEQPSQESLREKLNRNKATRAVKRAVVFVVGGVVVMIGILLLFLPGPAFLVIPAGLAILALEFERPRRWLRTMRAWLRRRREQRNVSPRSSHRQGNIDSKNR